MSIKKKNMENKITITKVINGYICEWKEESENEDNYIMDRKQVFEIDDSKEERIGELECLKKLFYFLQDQFGTSYNKHSSNINIEIIEAKE